MNMKHILGVLILVSILSISGCIDYTVPVPPHEIGVEYDIYQIHFNSYSDVDVLCCVNDTLDEQNIKFEDLENRYWKYSGVLIVDNESYLKLIDNGSYGVVWMWVDMGNTTPSYYYEVHVTKEDLEKYLD